MDIYYSKYLKYKNKYILLKNQLGGIGSNNIAYHEIGKDLTILEVSSHYKITGLISCIGIIIQRLEDLGSGNVSFQNGVSIHFIDGLHFNKSGLTECGNKIVDNMQETLLTWNKTDLIDINLIYSPRLDTSIHPDTYKTMITLKDFFENLVDFSNLNVMRTTTVVNGVDSEGYASYYEFST